MPPKKATQKTPSLINHNYNTRSKSKTKEIKETKQPKKTKETNETKKARSTLRRENEENEVKIESHHHTETHYKNPHNSYNQSVSVFESKTVINQNQQQREHDEVKHLKEKLKTWVETVKELKGIQLKISRIRGKSDFFFKGTTIYKDVVIKISEPTYSIEGYKNRFRVLVLSKIHIAEEYQRKKYTEKLIDFLNEVGKQFNPRRFVLIEAILNKGWFQSMRRKKKKYYPIVSDETSMLFVNDTKQLQEYK